MHVGGRSNDKHSTTRTYRHVKAKRQAERVFGRRLVRDPSHTTHGPFAHSEFFRQY